MKPKVILPNLVFDDKSLLLEFTCVIFMSMLTKFYKDMKRHNFMISINYWEPYEDIKEEKKEEGGILLYLEPCLKGITLVIKMFCKLNSN